MFEWNWAELIISFIGFLSAIGAAVAASKIREAFLIRKTVKKIVNELFEEKIDFDFEKEVAILDGEEQWYGLAYLPYLDRLMSTDRVLLLAKKKWYVDLIELYNDVCEINKWSSAKTDFYLSNYDAIKNNKQESHLYSELCRIVWERYKEYIVKVDKLINRIGA